MNYTERRLSLFNTYSTNWKLIRPSYPWHKKLPDSLDEAVICPLCLELLSKERLNQNAEVPLTLEHIPPSELGGKPKILTCKKCNNESGWKLDNTIVEYLKTQPFFALQYGAKIALKESKVESDIGILKSSATLTYLKDNILQFDLHIGKKESYRNELFRKLPAATKWGGEFKFNAPSLKYVNIALLRIGYLIAFSHFGNAFILNKRYHNIREQILNPESEVLPLTGVLETKNQLPIGIYKIRKPNEITGFYVSYPLNYEGKENLYGVFLPSPFIESVEYYNRLREYHGKTININYVEFPNADYLTNPENVFSCIKVFQNFTIKYKTKL